MMNECGNALKSQPFTSRHEERPGFVKVEERMRTYYYSISKKTNASTEAGACAEAVAP